MSMAKFQNLSKIDTHIAELMMVWIVIGTHALMIRSIGFSFVCFIPIIVCPNFSSQQAQWKRT